MSDALIVGLFSAVVSLIGIFVSAKVTRDKVTQKLDTNQQLMNNEINHIKSDINTMKADFKNDIKTMSDNIKTEMGAMKKDIQSHNNYAKLFNENIPLIKEKLSVANHRIEDIEGDIKYYHRKPHNN